MSDSERATARTRKLKERQHDDEPEEDRGEPAKPWPILVMFALTLGLLMAYGIFGPH